MRSCFNRHLELISFLSRGELFDQRALFTLSLRVPSGWAFGEKHTDSLFGSSERRQQRCQPPRQEQVFSSGMAEN